MGEASADELRDALETFLWDMGVRLSRYVNGVTTAHMNFSWLLFPAFHIRAVTNGVHPIGSCNMNVTVVSGNVTEV